MVTKMTTHTMVVAISKIAKSAPLGVTGGSGNDNGEVAGEAIFDVKLVLGEEIDRMRLITLNRPRQLNAISPELVIRNEALLLLTYLIHEAEEIQKIVVFEGAFEKIFSIIKEEGGSDGGVVVQDCLELLNNLLCNNGSNQTINLLGALETIKLLIMGGFETDPGKDLNRQANKTALVQVLPIFPWLVDLPLEKF
ncbi:hypothetical protein K1719_037432 [Acacia pycnantha]|nr:hypothetical protein K1719_037432 [Acacia pycnantha]